MLVDVLGRPAAVHLTGGNVSDIKAAPHLLRRAHGRIRHLIADRGYDADDLRRDLRARGTVPVIPGRKHRKRKVALDRRRYRERWRVEASVNRLKDFRRVATRYDKLAATYGSTVAIAALVAFWL